MRYNCFVKWCLWFQAAGRLYDLRDHDGYGYDSHGNWVELWGGHYSPFVLAKIWASILCHVHRLMEADGKMGEQPTIEQWAQAKAPFRRSVSLNYLLLLLITGLQTTYSYMKDDFCVVNFKFICKHQVL